MVGEKEVERRVCTHISSLFITESGQILSKVDGQGSINLSLLFEDVKGNCWGNQYVNIKNGEMVGGIWGESTYRKLLRFHSRDSVP